MFPIFEDVFTYIAPYFLKQPFKLWQWRGGEMCKRPHAYHLHSLHSPYVSP